MFLSCFYSQEVSLETLLIKICLKAFEQTLFPPPPSLHLLYRCQILLFTLDAFLSAIFGGVLIGCDRLRNTLGKMCKNAVPLFSSVTLRIKEYHLCIPSIFASRRRTIELSFVFSPIYLPRLYYHSVYLQEWLNRVENPWTLSTFLSRDVSYLLTGIFSQKCFVNR